MLPRGLLSAQVSRLYEPQLAAIVGVRVRITFKSDVDVVAVVFVGDLTYYAGLQMMLIAKAATRSWSPFFSAILGTTSGCQPRGDSAFAGPAAALRRCRCEIERVGFLHLWDPDRPDGCDPRELPLMRARIVPRGRTYESPMKSITAQHNELSGSSKPAIALIWSLPG